MLSGQWRLALSPDEEGGKMQPGFLARLAWALGLLGTIALVVMAVVRASVPEASLKGHGWRQERLGAQAWYDAEPDCSFADGPCPAQQLLESREVAFTVAMNVVAMGRLAGENISENTALAVTADVFETLVAEMQEHAPKLADELRTVGVSQEENEAIQQMLFLMSDNKVQGVGKTVATAIGQAGTMHRQTVTERIRRRLTPAWDSIRVLRNEAVPGPLRSLWGDGNPDLLLWSNRSLGLWEMTLEESNVFSVKKGGDMEAAEAALAASRGTRFAVFAAALVQGRAVLDVLQMYVHARGHSSHSALGRTLEFAFGALSWPCCIDPKPGEIGSGLMQELVCPLKFGAMGMDALRATFVDDASRALRERMATDPGGTKKTHAL